MKNLKLMARTEIKFFFGTVKSIDWTPVAEKRVPYPDGYRTVIQFPDGTNRLESECEVLYVMV